MDLVAEYLKLGLRFDRLVDGFVDAYTGDPMLKQQVADEPQPDPAELSRQATDLSRAVADTDLDPARAAFLTAHLDALAVSGRRLAGEQMSFIDEVQAYFQVRIEEIDTDVYAAAHDEISGLLGGSGPLADRLAALRTAETCPPDQVERAVQTVAAALRERVSGPTGLADLPEHIEFEIARDVAWSGFNYYLGNFRSRVAVNADIGHKMSQFGVLVAHECYPGHHTEHCRKEDLLVGRGGQAEHTIFLVNTPQCLMAEGLGDLALTAAVGPGWGRWLAEVLDGIGPAFDPDLAEALERASRPLNTVRQNSAILLHDRGAAADAIHDRSTVARLHLDLRRGRPAVAAVADRPARGDHRAAAVPAAARRAAHAVGDPAGTRGRLTRPVAALMPGSHAILRGVDGRSDGMGVELRRSGR